MKTIDSLADLQKTGIYIYQELLKECNNVGVKLYLTGGTLLGAVRHKGFIPWDDDIDVCMSRPDYEKLLRATKGVIGANCSIIDPGTDPRYKGVVPVCVYNNSYVRSSQFKEDENLKISCSIFVYDGVPENRLKRFLYYKHMFLLRAKHALCRADFKHVNTKTAKLFGPVLSPFFRKKSVLKYKNKILKLQSKYPYSESRLVSTNVDNGSQREVVEKVLFEKDVDIQFENIPSKTFGCYKEYLESYYGDYMTPPPVEQQKPKHGIYAEIDDSFNL